MLKSEKKTIQNKWFLIHNPVLMSRLNVSKVRQVDIVNYYNYPSWNWNCLRLMAFVVESGLCSSFIWLLLKIRLIKTLKWFCVHIWRWMIHASASSFHSILFYSNFLFIQQWNYNEMICNLDTVHYERCSWNCKSICHSSSKTITTNHVWPVTSLCERDPLNSNNNHSNK